MRVSLIVSTRNRATRLPDFLARISSLDAPPGGWELILVDNASSDDTSLILERFAATAAFPVRCVRAATPGLSHARNAGLACARGEIIAFTDDDTLLEPHWLERLTGAFDAPEIWGVSGLVLPSHLETVSQCVFEKIWGFGRGLEPRDYGSAYYFETRAHCTPVWELGAGANMGIRRSALRPVGGIEPRLGSGPVGAGDDSELWYRILHAGGIWRYEPSAIVGHTHRHDDAGLRRQIRSYMCGHVAALLIQHERTGDRGNLRRVVATLPRWYLRKALSRMRRGSTASTCLLREEIAGCLAGVAHYWRTRDSLILG